MGNTHTKGSDFDNTVSRHNKDKNRHSVNSNIDVINTGCCNNKHRIISMFIRAGFKIKKIDLIIQFY